MVNPKGITYFFLQLYVAYMMLQVGMANSDIDKKLFMMQIVLEMLLDKCSRQYNPLKGPTTDICALAQHIINTWINLN